MWRSPEKLHKRSIHTRQDSHEEGVKSDAFSAGLLIMCMLFGGQTKFRQFVLLKAATGGRDIQEEKFLNTVCLMAKNPDYALLAEMTATCLGRRGLETNVKKLVGEGGPTVQGMVGKMVLVITVAFSLLQQLPVNRASAAAAAEKLEQVFIKRRKDCLKHSRARERTKIKKSWRKRGNRYKKSWRKSRFIRRD
jgi:hypothetical protein